MTEHRQPHETSRVAPRVAMVAAAKHLRFAETPSVRCSPLERSRVFFQDR